MDVFTPNASDNRQMDELFKLLKDMESVSLVPQRDQTSLANVSFLFHDTVESFHELNECLEYDFYILFFNDFKNSVERPYTARKDK